MSLEGSIEKVVGGTPKENKIHRDEPWENTGFNPLFRPILNYEIWPSTRR